MDLKERRDTVRTLVPEAERDLALLRQELGQVDREIPEAEALVAKAGAWLDDLRAMFDGGRILAPRDGTIRELAVNLGEVVDRGSTVLRVFHGAPFVIAFVPPGRLFDVVPGQKVMVRAGFLHVDGHIESVYPIAPALPPEFSLAFNSTQRQQRIKIALDAPPPDAMPLFTTVRVTAGWNPVTQVLLFVAWLAAG